MSPNKIARIAGVLYLALVPLGIFGILYVPASLIVPGDAAATAGNIMGNELLFRLSIVSALVVQLVNILLVLVLYRLLKPAGAKWAALMVVFFLVSVPIAMLNELSRLAVLSLLGGAGSATAFAAGQLQDWAVLFLDWHAQGIVIAQIFWGLWLFPMGWLIFRSGYLPKVLGILLMIGCLGYVADSFTALAFPGFGVTFSEFTFLGEVLFPLWLLIKGVNIAEWEKKTRAPA